VLRRVIIALAAMPLAAFSVHVEPPATASRSSSRPPRLAGDSALVLAQAHVETVTEVGDYLVGLAERDRVLVAIGEVDAFLAAMYVEPAVRSTQDAPSQVSGGVSSGCGGATNGADRFIARESGGDPNVWNTAGSGAWGCWQILPSTWADAGCDELGAHGSAGVAAQAACASRLPLGAWGG